MFYPKCSAHHWVGKSSCLEVHGGPTTSSLVELTQLELGINHLRKVFSNPSKQVINRSHLQDVSIPLRLAGHRADLERHHMFLLPLSPHTAHNLRGNHVVRHAQKCIWSPSLHLLRCALLQQNPRQPTVPPGEWSFLLNTMSLHRIPVNPEIALGHLWNCQI